VGCQRRDIDGFEGPDRAIARLADGQRGRVSAAQLVEAGIKTDAVRRRVRRGFLRKEHHGVYLVGWHDTTKEGLLAGALLAAGPESAVSHRAAAELWSLMPGPTPVELSALRSHKRLRGVIVHRPRSLDDDVVEHRGLRVTTPARTLVDLCSSLSASHVARLATEAQIQRLVTRAELAEILDRSYGRRGTEKLKRFVRDETSPTRSQLEKRFVRLVSRAGLPTPRTNEHLWIGGRYREVDAHWPAVKLAVELDSFKVHGVRDHFESDRERDVDFVIDGWRVVRFTWARLRDDPNGVIRDVELLIGRPGPY
jgi:very-short-patch-repair endonuclease